MHRSRASFFALGSLVFVACGNTAPPPAAAPLETTATVAAPKKADPRVMLAAHRAEQLDRLHAYEEAGVFPFNPSADETPVHMFKDARGVRCAVANLIHLDGLDELVDRMATEKNDVVVADQKTGPLHEWVLASGLTNDEVRKIQGVGFVGGLDTELQRTQRQAVEMKARLMAVEAELRADTDKSLDVAVADYQASELALR